MSDPADLLRVLARVRVARPAELQAALGVSQPTLSRLVARAGTQVFRMGRGRATQYARARGIQGLESPLPIFRVSVSGAVESAGTLHLLGDGQQWWARSSREGTLFRGLPPQLVDMAPQGYIGRGFPVRFPELHLPERIVDWSDDHRIMALAKRGEDCVGDLVIGNESLARLIANSPTAVRHADYPNLATLAAKNIATSSAGGEQPKFGAFAQGRHVLVKFAEAADGAAARRWRDLLWCEWKALEIVAAAGLRAARAQCVDVEGWRCLEVERFDRIGERGRRAVVSLGALDDEHFGKRDNWTAAAVRLMSRPFSLPSREAAQLRWLDAFGQLIGNTDRHFGNVAFFAEFDGALHLAPAYDMLPMILAPVNGAVAARDFRPVPPGGDNLDVWSDAAVWAERYWREVQANDDLHGEVRAFAGTAALAVATLARRVALEPT